MALIAMLAGQKFGIGGSASPDGGGVAAGGAMPRAPDISGMTPRQMTDNLFERVMRAHEAGLADSARTLALTMGIPAFELHDSLDADLRYDLGRIAEVAGEATIATAQADTILAEHPSHLLGLVLAARMARVAGDSSKAREFDRRLLAAEQSELATNKQEYLRHKNDIDSGVALARRGRN